MEKLLVALSALMIALPLLALHPEHSKSARRDTAGEIKLALTCFKTGEQRSGMNKMCFYNCLGSTTAINVGAAELCPLTIEQ